MAGDEALLTDSNGQTYNYAVSEILEVPTIDLSMTYAGQPGIVSSIPCFGDGSWQRE